MDASQLTLIISLSVAIVIAALGYAFLGRKIDSHDRSAKRVANAVKPARERGAGKRGAAVDPTASRRKAVQDTLKEAEAKRTKKRATLRAQIAGAGLKFEPRAFWIGSAVTGVIVGALTYLGTSSPLTAGCAFVGGALGLPRWYLGFLTKRRQKAFVEEFANALDVIVRGVKSGLPVNECLKIIANESPEPVGPEFEDIIDGQKMGVPLDQALERMYERMPIAEVNFFMIVLAIQAKTGGNLAEALGNLSRVLRDRKKLKGKVAALSSEAKASAMIIGSLPFFVVGILYTIAPDYITLLFTERMGNLMLIGCGLWMLTGILVMKKMINFEV